MKKFTQSLIILTLAVLLAFSFAACGKAKPAEQSGSAAEAQVEQAQTQQPEKTEIEKSGIWENAVYLSDTELGKGAKTVKLEVKADEKVITFTVHTDEKTLGAALLENELIAGEDSEYGLYVKVVNGMTADYDIDKTYWTLYIDGEYALAGVDSTDIEEGTVYQLAYTK